MDTTDIKILKEIKLLPDVLQNIIVSYQNKNISIGINFSIFNFRSLSSLSEKFTMFIDLFDINDNYQCIYKYGILQNLSDTFSYINNKFYDTELMKIIYNKIEKYNINHIVIYFINTSNLGYKKICENNKEYLSNILSTDIGKTLVNLGNFEQNPNKNKDFFRKFIYNIRQILYSYLYKQSKIFV